jgi:hypothetical protein
MSVTFALSLVVGAPLTARVSGSSVIQKALDWPKADAWAAA